MNKKPTPITIDSILSDSNNISALCHLLGLLTHITGPLILLILYKGKSKSIEASAKESLNFQITLLVAWIISGILTLVLVGFLLIPIIIIATFVLPVIATMTTLSGKPYKYPVNLNLIK